MFATLKTIISIIPLILELIKSVETVLNTSGAGTQKLSFVKTVLTSVNSELETQWPIIEKIISAAVTLFNNTGTFSK